MKSRKKGLGIVALAIALFAVLVGFAPATAHAEVKDTDVARIGDTGYATLNEAVSAVGDGQTIEVIKDIPNATGMAVKSGSNFTIDFGGFTYTLVGPGAGSSGTETNAFQLLKDSTIVFKNGTVDVAENANNVKRIIQNYANLTLENMQFNTENLGSNENYALSFNNGDIVFKGNTSVHTSAPDVIAFDVCKYSIYPSAKVTFDDTYTGQIGGKIVYDAPSSDTHKITVNGNGTFVGIEPSTTEGASDAALEAVKVTKGTFSDSNVVNYMTDSVVALKDESGFKVMTDAEAKASGAAASVEKDGKTVYFTDAEEAKDYATENQLEGDPVKPVAYTVTFTDAQFNTKVDAQTVNFGEFVKKPDMPAIKDGYKFDGWFNGEDEFDFVNDSVKGDVTLTAKWTKAETPVITANDFTWDLAKGELTNADVFELSGAKAEPLDGDIFNFGVLTSDLEALLAAAKDGKTGAYELEFLVNESEEPYDQIASKKIKVTLVNSAKPADKTEDGKKDEGKKAEAALPKTGDASMLPMLVTSGAGVAAIAAGVIASKRRK